MSSPAWLAVPVIGIALVFDVINGMNDAANSIATIVSTRVLTPRIAVLWAAFFNFAAVAGFGVGVAKTIGGGIVDASVLSLWFVLAVFIVLSPLIGMALAMVFWGVVTWIFRRFSPFRVDRVFRIGQLVSSALFSLGHGANDAQKTMGMIVMVLVAEGWQKDFHVPFWVIFSCYTAIALGTLIGGWRVVKTMGMRMTKLQPVGGFCAELAAACSIIGSSLGGILVSTTHTITGGIIGVGATQSFSAVRWGAAGNIAAAWVLTIPGAGLVSALAHLGVERVGVN